MAQHNSTSTDPGHQAPKVFLVGNYDELHREVQCCPYASSWCCIEQATGLEAIIAVSCKRWGCKYCGPRKCFAMALRCETAAPTKLITLTVRNELYENPKQAFEQTRRKVSVFAKAVRLHVGEFEYLRVLEVTAKGWPHYHFVARCPFLAQGWLSSEWNRLTGATIVDIRAVKKQEGVFRYVMKYLCKQTYISFTDRRLSWSKAFFPKTLKEKNPNPPYQCGGIKPRHPADVMLDHYRDRQVTQRGPNLWVIEGTAGPSNRVPSALPLERKIQCRRKKTRPTT